MAAIAFRPATADDDLDRVERLLDGAGLPTSDVRAGNARFFLAVDDGSVVGVGGFEAVGSAGLLRSVAVDFGRRDEGVGTAICREVESRAAEAGVERLFLLTETAAGFFADLGYARRDRSMVPPAVRETPEFAELCPDTAVCMAKRLDHSIE